ncbi:MAG: serine protease, partial [Verrucomicrobiota bacterium]
GVITTAMTIGSGFVARIGKRNFLITNLHDLNAMSGPIKIGTTSGRWIEADPTHFDVAKKTDLVRIDVTALNLPALPLAESIVFDEAVTVFGDSQGQQAITTTEGRVLAVGPDRFEVSAIIVPGSSGGPVVGEAGEVLGVATFVMQNAPAWYTEGTRFADTRRWAVRIPDEDGWTKISAETFREHTAYLADLSVFTSDVIRLIRTLASAHRTVETDRFKDETGTDDFAERYNDPNLLSHVQVMAEACVKLTVSDGFVEDLIRTNEAIVLRVSEVAREARETQLPFQPMEDEKQERIEALDWVAGFFQAITENRQNGVCERHGNARPDGPDNL